MADAYVTLNEAAELEGTTYARCSAYAGNRKKREHFQASLLK